jgi:hypothetical protein
MMWNTIDELTAVKDGPAHAISISGTNKGTTGRRTLFVMNG